MVRHDSIIAHTVYMALTVPPLTCRFQKIDRVRLERDNFFNELLSRDYDWIMANQDNRTFGLPSPRQGGLAAAGIRFMRPFRDPRLSVLSCVIGGRSFSISRSPLPRSGGGT